MPLSEAEYCLEYIKEKLKYIFTFNLEEKWELPSKVAKAQRCLSRTPSPHPCISKFCLSVCHSVSQSVSQLTSQSNNQAEKANDTVIVIGQSVIEPVYEQVTRQLVSQPVSQ